MKKLILFLTVAALFMGSAAADAGTRRDVTDLGATELLADGAIDTLGAFSLSPNLKWHLDADAAAGDGNPVAYLLVTFTAASTDSFSVVIDYYLDEFATTHVTTATSFVARTSGTMFVVNLDPTYPAEAIKVRLANTDVTGTAACTNLDAYLVQILDD